jgi:hypothetical protein
MAPMPIIASSSTVPLEHHHVPDRDAVAQSQRKSGQSACKTELS